MAIEKSLAAQAKIAAELMNVLLQEYGPRDFTVRFWDTSILPSETKLESFTLAFESPEAFWRIILHPNEQVMGESFIWGDLQIEGNFEAAFRLGDYLMVSRIGVFERMRFVKDALPFLFSRSASRDSRLKARLTGTRNSKGRARQAISYHYDLPIDFWRHWLDERLVYSCAYFITQDDDINTAQQNKLDYICTKLDLREGEHFLDVGCGWGSLVIHAAEHYGVRAHGITISRAQAEHAQERIAKARLGSRCKVELKDFREVDDWEHYDKAASIGMIEHVGRKLMKKYFGRVHRLLKPGGLFLNQGISFLPTKKKPAGPSFVERYVFPDGELVPIGQTIAFAEGAGFELRDVENLREHYARTLTCWGERLDQNRNQIVNIVSEARYRIYRLYIAGAAYAHHLGRNTLIQTLLRRPGGLIGTAPSTRSHWYKNHPSPSL